jgi:uncharacterized protein YcbX
VRFVPAPVLTAEQVPGIAYPTTYADLARLSHNTLFTRWVGDRSEAAISPREAFIAARQLPVAAPVQAEQAQAEPVRMSQRASFEHWYSDGGQSPKAVERDGEGYKLMGAQAAWNAWKACYAALDVTGRPSGPPSRDLDSAVPAQAEQAEGQKGGAA